MTEARDLTVSACDGLPLGATLFAAPASTQAVILGGATGVPRGYYAAFARYLADRGAAVLTYDYRGSGGTPASLRRSNARMRDWGVLDFPGAVAWMRERYPALALRVVGHSFGGHALAMAPNNDAIERTVLVASHSGYWGYFAPSERRRIRFMMGLVAPSIVRALGYLPASAMGFGEDLARGVVLDWARWCSSPNYFFDDDSMAAILARIESYRAPTLSLALADDPWGTRSAVEWLAARFTNAPFEIRTLVPQAFSLESIGHTGFFRERNGAALWPVAARYLGLMEAAA